MIKQKNLRIEDFKDIKNITPPAEGLTVLGGNIYGKSVIIQLLNLLHKERNK